MERNKRRKKKSQRLKKTDAPGISKEGVQSGIETFKKNSKQKIKDMNITALSKDDDADVEIVREIYRAEYDSRGLDPAGKDEWVENNTQAIFKGGTEGFVDNRTGNVYMVADNIMAVDTSTSATDRLTQVLFHEIIGHVGLKAFLGAQFETFINRFLKTNNKLLKRWATEGTGQVYLPKELRGKELKVRQKGYDKMSSDEKFTIAEEYIAQHFAEHGARDPNLIDRIAVHIARALNKQGLYDKQTPLYVIDWGNCLASESHFFSKTENTGFEYFGWETSIHCSRVRPVAHAIAGVLACCQCESIKLSVIYSILKTARNCTHFRPISRPAKFASKRIPN